METYPVNNNGKMNTFPAFVMLPLGFSSPMALNNSEY
jgi:hypothetical protein